MAEPDFTKGASPQSPYDTLPTGLGLGPLASQIGTLLQTGVMPTGTASGDLTGSYPNPSIANGAVTNAKLAAGAVDNAKVATLAGIVYSKLNLTASIVSADIVDGTLVNADISASAAIGYSKLALTGSITSSDIVDGTLVNADINASAGIVPSKLALGPASNTVDAVTLTTAGTYYDGAALSLTAGTWLLVAHGNVTVAVGAGDGHLKLWDGSTVSDTDQATASAATEKVSLFATAIVSPGSTTTYKVSFAADQNGSTLEHSRLTAVRVG